jgi:hypothetical protein
MLLIVFRWLVGLVVPWAYCSTNAYPVLRICVTLSKMVYAWGVVM